MDGFYPYTERIYGSRMFLKYSFACLKRLMSFGNEIFQVQTCRFYKNPLALVVYVLISVTLWLK